MTDSLPQNTDSLVALQQALQTKLMNYVYISIESPSDSLLSILQTISGIGNLNWHLPENNVKLASVFTQYANIITNYQTINGDFRSYCLLSLVNIILTTYQTELINLLMSSTYNISPDTALPIVAENYSTQLPQTSNFPDTTNTSNDFDPPVDNIKLIPQALYPTTQIDQ